MSQHCSDVTLNTMLTKRYTNVSSMASNGQKPHDQSQSVEVTSEASDVTRAAETNGVLFKRLKDIRNH